MEWYRDPAMQTVEVIMGVGGIVVALLISWGQLRRKRLSYLVVTDTPLLTVEETIRDNLQILYDHTPVRNVRLLEVMIQNSGNVPVLARDYEAPVCIHFGHEAKVLTTTVTDSVPTALRASVCAVADEVRLSPVLLNRGDMLIVRTLVSDANGDLRVEGHIAGVKRLTDLAEKNPRYVKTMISLFVTFVAAGLATGASIAAGWAEIATVLRTVSLVAGILTFTGVMIEVFKDILRTRRVRRIMGQRK